MIEVEQNDLVQHKHSKNVYRVVNTGVLTNSVLLELYPTFDTIEVTLEEISRDYIKIEGSLVAPNVKVIHKQTNLCLRLDGALPDKIKSIVDNQESIQRFAANQASERDVFFVGRGIDYAVCLEGSLKLKEISYIHSEAYAAGELKHGTISLIEKGMLVIGVLTQDDLYEKTISNMVECKSRGANLMALTTVGNYSIEECSDFVFYIPPLL